jgi:hypothetical protein
MAKKASNDAMAELHNALATVLADKLGEEEVQPAMLNVARQFLKDNGIENNVVAGNPMDILKDAELPFINTADNVTTFKKRKVNG